MDNTSISRPDLYAQSHTLIHMYTNIGSNPAALKVIGLLNLTEQLNTPPANCCNSEYELDPP